MKPLEQLTIPLLEWFQENARVLPWREDPTPYHVWVSEIMLQQTRVAAVLDYYRRFLEELPEIRDLAACPEDRLMKLWQGLGYYSRARNLQKAARQIMEQFQGVFPDRYADIRSLAGVGDYTAGAIASIAFSIPVPAVDGNVLRVAARVTGDRHDITRPETKRALREELLETMPQNMPGAYNQALMELGALICLPNGTPACERCPAQDFCTAYRENLVSELPVKAPKRARRIEDRTVYLIFHDNRIALRRRPARGLLAGLWEYPNECSPWKCPVPGDCRFGARGKHIFSHIEWHMTAYVVQTPEPRLPEHWIWADQPEWNGVYAIPSAFSAFSTLVEQGLASNPNTERNSNDV